MGTEALQNQSVASTTHCEAWPLSGCDAGKPDIPADELFAPLGLALHSDRHLVERKISF